MHSDMMRVVGLRGQAEAGAEEPRNIKVQEVVLFFEQGAMAGVVHHENEGSEQEATDQVIRNVPYGRQVGMRQEPDPRQDEQGGEKHKVNKGKIARIPDQLGKKAIIKTGSPSRGAVDLLNEGNGLHLPFGDIWTFPVCLGTKHWP